MLFEGSLTLHLDEWKEIGTVVRRMVTIGALVTWGVIALATHYLLDFTWEMALLFGTLTLVTGPTVIVPMLRVVRPNATIANILRWEGIVIDPIGAILAVVVYTFIAASDAGSGWTDSLLTFISVIGCGILFGLLGGQALGVALRRHWLPDYLHNLASLSVVLGVFVLSNTVMSESGLLAVTVMGLRMANMQGVDVRHILHFKENLSVLLISGLFVLLAARLDLPALLGLGPIALLVLVLIQFVARPLNVLIATAGSTLNWRERALLSWIAPRGIVAAAVSAIFAIRLQEAGHAQAGVLVPLTFLVIIGTVILQSATARPLARLLKVAEPVPTGFLIIGANPVARAIGTGLQNAGVEVLLTDSSWENTRAARMDNLPTYFGNPASQHAEAHLDLIGLGTCWGLVAQCRTQCADVHELSPRVQPAPALHPAQQPGQQAQREASGQRPPSRPAAGAIDDHLSTDGRPYRSRRGNPLDATERELWLGGLSGAARRPCAAAVRQGPEWPPAHCQPRAAADARHGMDGDFADRGSS